MIRKLFKYYSPALIIILILLNVSSINAADKKNHISISTAVFDIIKKNSMSLEGRIEYRFDSSSWTIKPFSGIMTNTSNALHLYSGFFVDIPFTDKLSLVPSFAPGFYFKGNSKELSLTFQFRTQIEFVLQLPDDIKISISVNHISNGGIRKPNLGVESLALSYFFPI